MGHDTQNTKTRQPTECPVHFAKFRMWRRPCEKNYALPSCSVRQHRSFSAVRFRARCGPISQPLMHEGECEQERLRAAPSKLLHVRSGEAAVHHRS